MGERSGRSNGEIAIFLMEIVKDMINWRGCVLQRPPMYDFFSNPRYDTKLVGARKAGVMRGAIVAVGAGFMWYGWTL